MAVARGKFVTFRERCELLWWARFIAPCVLKKEINMGRTRYLGQDTQECFNCRHYWRRDCRCSGQEGQNCIRHCNHY
jgi:hypothetical protein